MSLRKTAILLRMIQASFSHDQVIAIRSKAKNKKKEKEKEKAKLKRAREVNSARNRHYWSKATIFFHVKTGCVSG